MPARIRNQFSSFMRTLGIVLFLKMLSLIAWVTPSCGNWIKRLFFILSLYHELQRHQLFKGVSLDRLNVKLLQIKEPTVLSNVSEIAQQPLMQYDFTSLSEVGVNIQKILETGKITQSEALAISNVIAKQTPPGLRYGESAMISDITRLLCQMQEA